MKRNEQILFINVIIILFSIMEVVQGKVDRVLSHGYYMELDGSEQVQSLFPFPVYT